MVEAGVCRLCASHLGLIGNMATGKVSTVTVCPHCDSPCDKKPCKRCSRMASTVRIVDKPDAA